MDVVDPETRLKAYNWCKDYLGGAWKKIKSAELQIVKLSGGFTNHVFLCSLPSDQKPVGGEPNKALLRVYAETLGRRDYIADKTHKLDAVVSALLSERQFGPKLYGVFTEGTLEEYISSKCLRTSDLADPDISQKIAVKTAKLHQFEFPTSRKRKLGNDKFMELMHYALNAKFEDPDWQRYVDKLRSCNVEAEYQFVRKLAAGTTSPIVFNHQDIHAENILVREDDSSCGHNNELVFVDYEYSGYGTRAMDIAGHFAAWMLDFSFSDPPYFKYYLENYPTREQQLLFIRAYLGSFDEGHIFPHGSREAEEESILREVTRFAPIRFFNAAIVFVTYAMFPQVKLGYAEFAMQKLDLYFAFKKKLPDDLRPNME